jgi:hypothetical protein
MRNSDTRQNAMKVCKEQARVLRYRINKKKKKKKKMAEAAASKPRQSAGCLGSSAW